MRPRGTRIHECRCDGTTRVGNLEECGDLMGCGKRMNGDIRYYACGGYRAVQFFVFDLVLFLVEFTFAQKVVDGFVVLRVVS